MRCQTAGRCLGFGFAAAVVAWVGAFAQSPAPSQSPFSYHALSARLPVVRELSYAVNGRARPLLFWVGRDNIGGARITWRAASDDHRAVELLIGSDPTRAPRRINRWGFILEELNADTAEVLGAMKESSEQTIEEADARTKRQDDDVSVFKAARTVITGSRAVGGSMTVRAPRDLTYHDLDALLALIPAEPPRIRTVGLPPGAQKGFLVAMETLIRQSIGPCSAERGSARGVTAVPYVYNQTLYDLSLTSCRYEREMQTTKGTLTGVVDGRFQVRNRTTTNETKFGMSYGTLGELREMPVRAVFRPRWWLEIELVLDPSPGGAL
jgi:hypothetical protein